MITEDSLHPYLCSRDSFLITTDFDRVDLDFVHRFLTEESYWARGIAKETVERSLRHSLCFSLFTSVHEEEAQIGFARAITDRTTFAYLADVFVISSFRGRGLGKWLISCILAHPDMQGLRKWMLNTKDAHGLYEPFGFRLHTEGETIMVYRPTPREDGG
jgi:GNAT superfamily N-acetyltransferase